MLLILHGVIGLFPANAVGSDDIEVYSDDTRASVLCRFHTLRQQDKKRAGVAGAFVKPVSHGMPVWVFVVALLCLLDSSRCEQQGSSARVRI